jgi:hypothetical protein
MKKISVVLGLAGVAALGACADQTSSPVDLSPSFASGPFWEAAVTSDSDAGPGSFRSAVQAANADPAITSIRFAQGVGTVVLAGTVTYSGSQPLSIDGRGATVDASAVGDAFVATGGASLSFSDLAIVNAGGDGIHAAIPGTATGTVEVVLRGVTIQGAGEFGLHVDDQTNNSLASVSLSVLDSRILDNGFEPTISDKDGIRVDEGGPGDIVSRVERSTFTGNAADGIEYDEKGDGDVRVTVKNSVFDNNGTQPQDPSDLEDGFDIDEADEGSLYADFLNVSASGNDDGGIDLDEAGPGSIVSWMNQVECLDNQDDNIKLTEDGDVDDGDTEPEDSQGGIEFRFQNVLSLRSGDNGIQLEEFGNGDVNGTLVNSESSDNGDDGVNIEQADEGGGAVRLQTSVFKGNADKNQNIKGVTVLETG